MTAHSEVGVVRARRRGLHSVCALGALALVGLVSAMACSVTVPEDATFTCQADADCGGDGYVCVRGGVVSYCCLAQPEQCNGRDDDCNGAVDDGPSLQGACYAGPPGTAGVGRCHAGAWQCLNGVSSCEGEVLPEVELCNGLDDDCDGQADEDFDLQTDEQHCGKCNFVCRTGSECLNGKCPLGSETRCADGLDEDDDLATDCADSDCNNQSCGNGCTCSGGVRTESRCNNGSDDDGDGRVDCLDSDCLGKLCKASPFTFVCEAGGSCRCNGVSNPSAETSACGNGVDDDCDGAIDCADPGCAGASCGAGCSCP